MGDFSETSAIGEGRRLRAMASAIGGAIGHVFPDRVVSALRDAMDAELVFIAIGNGHFLTGYGPFSRCKGAPPPRAWNTCSKARPRKRVYGGSTIVIPKERAQRFPKDEGLEGDVGVPIRDKGGAIIGHFAAVISDLVRVNDTLRTRSQALHDANQFKTGLLGMMAHDLRNPLAVLVAKAELLQTGLGKEGLDRDRATRDVPKILDAADRRTSSIGAILTRCRAERSEIELRRRATDITALARIALETNRDEARRKRIRRIEPSVGEVWLDVHAGLCLEAIDYLVSNASKYSPLDTCANMRVRVTDLWVEVSVTDHGQGLSEVHLRRAFQPFQTLSTQPTVGETATGLDLVNARRIAESHGGEARVDSDGQGLGATFRFRLPARPAASEGPASEFL